MIRVEYMNVGESGDRCHEFLELCRSEGVGVAFTGEAAAYRNGGTMTIVGYNIMLRWGKGYRVVAYVTVACKGKMKLTYQNKQLVILGLEDKVIAGTYGNSKASRKGYQRWLKGIQKHMGRKEGVIMGDWNVHHRIWACKGNSVI